MKKITLLLLLSLIIISCEEKNEAKLKVGEWWATMRVAENEELPFNFSLLQDGDNYTMEIRNAEELILVDEFEFYQDSIKIQMPIFEGYIAGKFSEKEIKGNFIKESLDRIVPFNAKFGKKPRFEPQKESTVNISGVWEVDFDYDKESAYPAKGIFTQEDEKVTGTFRTNTGDYRYLEGIVDGSNLKLSTFDGAHVFLFTASATDSTLNGVFYSGNHSVENFKAKRNDAFELADANTLTYIKEGYDRLEFSFPNENGDMISLSDDRFKEKAVLVQIMGTWCPNCLDETKFYKEYLTNSPNPDLEIIALAFEYAKTEEKAFKGIQRLKDRLGIDYPILLAQFGSTDKILANQKLPMLNHVLSYPTTIYIDKGGNIQKIHTGFNGPATGEKHEEFKKEFTETLEKLLAE
ncbi:TlpA disulfide reductase family protein [uncultured Croceitalea sp.]|uniref:TlpA disulfide reductase family protein n=1 Tax=uncultured Croceitalea sp. TaxID=1798908 RepID=UPI00374F1B84